MRGSLLLPLFVYQMLCVFNPEHDLCLANGNCHYVPPASALAFAKAACGIMGVVYPSAICLPVSRVGEMYRGTDDDQIVPWGWNMTLKYDLLRQGVSKSLLPSDSKLEQWRELQHRTTLLPLQPSSRVVTTEAEVESMLYECSELVLKAPWSGSGRGLRWVSGRLGDHDKAWLHKVVREQRCAIAEPRWKVKYDYALEYRVNNGRLTFVGFSLFESTNGVYRFNHLLDDETICRRVGITSAQCDELSQWLETNVVPYYEGPLGVDCICDDDGQHHISEINLRHTMGLIAHVYLLQHPEAEGSRFSPMDFVG